MLVKVRYSPSIDVVCREPGLWLVTTHNRQVVKIQRAEESPVDLEAGEGEFGEVGPLLVTVRLSEHAENVERILSRNGQWIVRSSQGVIAQVSFVDKPEVVQDVEVETVETPKTRPSRKTRAASPTNEKDLTAKL